MIKRDSAGVVRMTQQNMGVQEPLSSTGVHPKTPGGLQMVAESVS